MPSPELTTGQRVVWRRTPRGGYGYIERIPAIVVRVGKRVTIRATLAAGGTKLVSVRPENIAASEDQSHANP